VRRRELGAGGRRLYANGEVQEPQMSHDDDDLGAGDPRLWRSARFWWAVVSWLFIGAALLAAPKARVPLLAAAILAGAHGFAREALERLRERREVGIDLLMTVAVVGAAAIGRWQEAALVAALFSISETLEEFAVRRTRYAIRGLMDRVPPRAHVLRPDGEIEVDLKDVRIGERVRVRPGESIPVDGVVVEGASDVDQSPVTGESVAVDRQPGDSVFAGALNGSGMLVLEARKAFEDNTVSTIVRLVEEAQGQKARVQLWVERFGRIYSPIVLGSALLLALIPTLLGSDVGGSLRLAIAVLVAAAPCALAVATPVTVATAIGSAARHGVLIKGGAFLESLGRARVVALDKTGTLTLGRPAVKDVLSLQDDEESWLRLAAAVEHLSEHPLAKAIVAEATARRLEVPSVDAFSAITAAGVRGTVEGKVVMVLKPAAVQAQGIDIWSEADAWRSEAEADGRTVVVVVVEGQVRGLIALADAIRPQAKGLVRALRDAGIDHVVMLTGDNPRAAAAVAAELGINEYFAGLVPEQKVTRIQELRTRFGDVVMVGDGINDAPALAAASVGVAMGTAGSDAALASADVALMGDNLALLEYAVRLGGRSSRIVRQGIGLSLLIVAGLLAGVLSARIDMLLAVLVHEGSEVLIIGNGLRAAWVRHDGRRCPEREIGKQVPTS
jgi:heavy metal translocating P-type ATPase